MTKMELLSPPLSVVQTSIGTIAMIEIDVNQPTPAINLTRRGTLGEAYFLSLHVSRLLEVPGYMKDLRQRHPTQGIYSACECSSFLAAIPHCRAVRDITQLSELQEELHEAWCRLIDISVHCLQIECLHEYTLVLCYICDHPCESSGPDKGQGLNADMTPCIHSRAAAQAS